MSATAITAAVVERGGAPFDLQSVELSSLQPDEVRVRIVASGICHTDLLIRDGTFPTPMPVVLGHEGAGVVEEVGAAVTRVTGGRSRRLHLRVVRRLPHVRRGPPVPLHGVLRAQLPGHARGRQHRDLARRRAGALALLRPVELRDGRRHPRAQRGGHSRRRPVRARGAVRLRDTDGRGQRINILRPLPNSSLAIFGVGGVGLAAVMAAAIVGCSPIIAVDVRPGRLALAQELGATTRSTPPRSTRWRRSESWSRAGSRRASRPAASPASCARPSTCSAPTRPAGWSELRRSAPRSASTSTACCRVGRGIKGMVEGHSVPEVFIPKLIELWRAGRLPVERLVRAYDFDQINQAAEDALAGEVVKPVLRMS